MSQHYTNSGLEKRLGIAKANIESATFDGISVDCRIPRDIVMQVSDIDKTGEEVLNHSVFQSMQIQ